MGHRSAAALIALAFVVATGPGCLRSRAKVEQEHYVARVMPAKLEAGDTVKGEPRLVKLRVYAGSAYQAQIRRWKEQFDVYIDLANQVFVPELGLRLVVADYKDWTHDESGKGIKQTLDELRAVDPASDVDVVVGLVSSLSVASLDMGELGYADYLGQHVVLRGYNDLAEYRAFSRNLDRMSKSDIRNLLLARKQHKQTTLILHEFGHIFGALHVDPKLHTIMTPAYSSEVSRFAPANVAIMRVVLAARFPADDNRDGWREKVAVALRDYLVGNDRFPGWLAADYDQARALLDSQISAAGSTPDRPGDHGKKSSGPAIPKEAEVIVRRVAALVQQSQLDAAWTELEGLLVAYPANTEIRFLSCQLWLIKEGAGATALGHCQRVGELDPGDVRGELAVAQSYIKAGQIDRVGAALKPAIDRLPSLDPEAQKKAAITLASFCRGLNAVTWVESLVTAAPPSDEISELREWAVRTRRRYGLPPRAQRFGVPPEREGEYVIKVRGILDLVYAKQYDEARKLAKSELRTFRDAPGLLGALCDLEIRNGQYGAAEPYCRRAVKGYPDISWPRYLLGIIELRYRRNRAGIAHLERAIAADPELKQAYHALYQAYARVNNRTARQKLADTYQQRFGVPIP